MDVKKEIADRFNEIQRAGVENAANVLATCKILFDKGVCTQDEWNVARAECLKIITGEVENVERKKQGNHHK